MRFNPKMLKPLTLVILGYGLLCYMAVVARAFQIIRFPYTIDYGESTILYQVKILFDGFFPYRASAFDSANYFSYTPLFQSVVSILGSDPIMWLREARILNTVSLLLTGVLISKFYVDGKSEKATAIDWALPFLLWISWYPVFNWTGMGRLDGVALFFQMMGLFLYLREKNQGSSRFMAMICFFLAIFTKQSALWVPCSLFLYDLINRKFEKSWVVFAVGLITGFMSLNYFSENTLFGHLFSSNNNSYHLSNLLISLKENGLFHLGILLVTAFGVSKLQIRGRDQLVIILGLLSLIYVWGMGREGSGSNFLLEFCVVLTWLTMRGIEALSKSWKWSAVAAILIVATCWQNMRYRTYFLKDPGVPTFVTAWSEEVKQSTEIVIERIKSADGPVWSDNPALLLFAGKDIEFFPFEYKQAVARGKLDEFFFVKDIEDKKVAMIVMERNKYLPTVQRFSDNILKAIETAYRPSYQNDYYLVIVPGKL
ncbi:hypothetical protein DOM22_19055 [Bdellovibrio sp. ZAP7]|uniref:hypothetical protein n=1 Tax=Bdellovibrio sp. ZAP7 TaxID=2231053 RepID=UPI0011643686|nr:hypothetical protein [Bdellovibrio sp. ZAP7]QDK47112.1 hypothetical protein DOM22_19055 [Bdellovibrio sp. ZAP7]